MDQRADERARRIIYGAPKAEPGERREMSRGQQTKIIVIAMVLLAIIAWRYMEMRTNPCAEFIGSDPSCVARMAMDRLNARF